MLALPAFFFKKNLGSQGADYVAGKQKSKRQRH
jgi:hypothetical protein